MRLSVTIRPATRNRKTVEVRDSSGTLRGKHTSALDSGKHYKDASRETGLPTDLIRERADRVNGPDDVEEFTWGEDPPPFTVFVRGRLEPATSAIQHTAAEPLEALRSAIETAHLGTEPIISWDGLDTLAAVDLDYHQHAYDARPTHAQLRALADLVEPRARCVWSTHGRGLRLIYTPIAGYTAAELAGVAALALVSREPSARVEIKTVTRHPEYPRGEQVCGPVDWITGDCNLDSVRGWLGRQTVDAAEVQNWLSSTGLIPGRRYPHSACPVRPDDSGGRNPVAVHDNGVFCYACAGRGVTRGSRRPGWFPFGALCGRTIDTTLSSCLRRFTHWEHAQHVVEDATGMNGDTARAAYLAALKVLHGADDPRVPLAGVRGHNLIRLPSGWSHLDGTAYVQHEPILASLPSTMVLTSEGSLASCRASVARLLQNTDLTREGYPTLTPVYGHRVYTHWLPPRNPLTVPVVVQTGDLAKDVVAGFRPRYRPAVSRMPIAEAWSRLEEVLPGLPREYVQLIIAARGCQEGEGGLPPMMFACGPTGASKSASIHVAAAILGDRATEVPWNKETERIRQGLLTAKEGGTICVFNEFLKDASKDIGGAVNAMDLVLNITPGSVSHALYRGPVRLGNPPVCVWTDTVIPEFVRTSEQVSRRIVAVELSRSVRWEKPLSDAGITGPTALRTQGGPDLVAACDAILSHVIDHYFRTPTDFIAIARDLGFCLIRDSAGGTAGREILRQLFRAVCLASPHESACRRFGGRGWVEVPAHSETDLSTLWRDVADESGRDSRRLTEVDWCGLLGAESPIKAEIKSYGRTVYLRFVQRTTARDYLVNGEISTAGCTVTVEVEPEDDTNQFGDLSWFNLLPNGISDS